MPLVASRFIKKLQTPGSKICSRAVAAVLNLAANAAEPFNNLNGEAWLTVQYYGLPKSRYRTIYNRQMCVTSHLLCARDLLPARRPLFGMSMLCAQQGITCNLAGRRLPYSAGQRFQADLLYYDFWGQIWFTNNGLGPPSKARSTLRYD